MQPWMVQRHGTSSMHLTKSVVVQRRADYGTSPLHRGAFLLMFGDSSLRENLCAPTSEEDTLKFVEQRLMWPCGAWIETRAREGDITAQPKLHLVLHSWVSNREARNKVKTNKWIWEIEAPCWKYQEGGSNACLTCIISSWVSLFLMVFSTCRIWCDISVYSDTQHNVWIVLIVSAKFGMPVPQRMMAWSSE